jgi:hypothetical protein
MRLSVIGLACTVGVLWGAAILFVGLLNIAFPSYGVAFLELISSVYPGYDYAPGCGFGETIVGALYGLVDGAIAGLLFALLYNLFAGLFAKKT